MPGRVVAARSGATFAEIVELSRLDPECSAGVIRKQRFVMRGNQRRDAPAVEVAKDAHDSARRVLVKVGGRLVGDQDGRAVDDCPGDGQALLLAA